MSERREWGVVREMKVPEGKTKELTTTLEDMFAVLGNQRGNRMEIAFPQCALFQN